MNICDVPAASKAGPRQSWPSKSAPVFEMVSRWERGITVPSVYYRERLCSVLGQSAEELGLLRGHTDAVTPLPSQLVFLASAHTDADKPIVSHLRTTLQEQGVTLWNSRQLGRQRNGRRTNCLARGRASRPGHPGDHLTRGQFLSPCARSVGGC